MFRKRKDMPVRLYPKKEKSTFLNHDELKMISFFTVLFVIAVIAIVLAIGCKSYYYTSLV